MKYHLFLFVAAAMAGAIYGSSGVVQAQALKAHAYVMPSGLMDYWKFDDNGGPTAIDCVGGYNASLNPGDSWTMGIIKGAVHFNGSSTSYVSVPSGIMGTTSDFTICTWVKVDANAMWNRIFDFGSGTNSYMFLSPYSGDNTVRFAITTSGNNDEERIDSTAPLTVGIWHHVAVTVSQTVGILYIDGIEVGQNNNMTLKPSSLGRTTQDYIGKSQWAADPTLSGAIDDFRIYNRALRSSEIVALARLTGE